MKILKHQKKQQYIFIEISKSYLEAYSISKNSYKIKYTLKEFLPLSNKNTKALKGSSAFQGKVCGCVHIVHTQKDAENFKEGEILVSSMTTPALFSAMQKAAAFITDEGRVLSHAAIVSRELKVPCIVGTNNATQLLNNGTMVEVDANNGVVKILKKTNEL